MADLAPGPILMAQGEPVLAEVLMSLPLFKSFLRFMSSEMAHENVLFLKEVQLFSYMLRPTAEMHKEACRIFFTFVCEGAPMAVNVGSDTQKAISTALWNREDISSRLFDDACLEIRNLIMPKFREWLALKEWAHVQFERVPPPSFVQVLHIPQLIASLCEFIKKQNLDNLMFEQFKTTDGVAEEHPPATNIDELDLSLRSCDELCNLLHFCASISELVESAGKKGAADEESARSLWNHYRKKVPIKHAKGIRYLPFVKQWLQWLISEFSDSTVFGDWVDQRLWVLEAAYEPKPRQTLDEHGYQEFPTLATLITNKAMAADLMTVFGDSEITRSVRFLTDVYKFVEKYSKALVDTSSSTSSESVMKQMTIDAKELFSTYIGTEGGSDASIVVQSRQPASTPPVCVTVEEPGEGAGGEVASPMKIAATHRKHSLLWSRNNIMLDKKLKAELRSNLFSRFKARITYDMFTRCGAYVYRHCESTWFRDFQHSFMWTCTEYDNNSLASRAVESLFDPSLVRDFPVSYPPIMDEILNNKELRESYVRAAYKNESDRATLQAFIDDSLAACASDMGDQMATETRRLVDMIALLPLNTSAELPVRYIHDGIASTEDVSPLVLKYLRSIVFESALALNYTKWSKGSSHGHVEWSTCTASQMTESSCITRLLESFLEKSTPAVECASMYGRTLIMGRQVLLQKTPSSFRLVDSSSNAGAVSSSASSTAGTEPLSGTAGASSADSSSSSSVSTNLNSVTSEGGMYLVNSSSADGVPPLDVPPLSLSTNSSSGKRGKNPLAANAEVIVTPHPRVSDIISYMPRVPTLDETMDSVLLRKIFEDYYLFPRLVDDTERNLWRSLRDFASCFAHMTDEEFTTRQPELRAQAQEILDLYPSYLRKQPFLKSRLTNNCIVTIRFFREEEAFLYGRAHQSYESLLEKSGWLRL